jgi:Asp-tRNA(Asn)/Glu-tRNA(Gln) amidotransferase A subunit family amidase
MKQPHSLTASEALIFLASGALDSESLVRDCLDRIAAREAEVRAWAQVDAEGALRAAREADKQRQIRSNCLGPLHGIPIGIKDVIGTAELRTEYNSPIYWGHCTNADAAAVAMLRAAGAIVIGKTETVEFAAWKGRISLARNPKDLSRTPGGSSSGSAAAVADCMVPLTLGTQTGGSLIRPASYCGVVGFKPTFNTVSTEGVKRYCATLDTLGWYARSIEDVELIAQIFEISDEPRQRPPEAQSLRVGFCGTPYLEAARPETRVALMETKERLVRAGASVVDIELDERYANLNECRQTVMRAEGRVSFLDLERTRPGKISPGIRETIKRVENRTLRSALDHAAALRPAFDELASNFDAIVTPSATGEAPPGLESTGDSIFNGLWTLLHVPCINIPGLTGPLKLPVGIQLVGPRYADARLLAAAQTISDLLQA